jgi:hypothetical protein
MAIATTTNSAIPRILDALGLKYVRSLRLNMELNSAVAVVTEQYVTGDQLERLAMALETKEWVLVPRDEWEHAVNAAPASDLMDEAAAEIENLREAIRRLAEQDATLSVCDGNVTVTIDGTLTGKEREAIRFAAVLYAQGGRNADSETLWELLHRTK